MTEIGHPERHDDAAIGLQVGGQRGVTGRCGGHGGARVREGSAPDELVVQKQGGEHADKGHIVTKADDFSSACLVEQANRRLRVEVARLFEARHAEQVGHVIDGFAIVKKTLAVGGAVRLLGAMAQRVGQQAVHAAFEQVFFHQAHEFVARRELAGEGDQPVIEEGKTGLDGLRHGHAIALRTQQIARHQGMRLDVLILAERLPARDVGGELRGEGGDGVGRRGRGAPFRRQKAGDAPCGGPARQVGEPGLAEMRFAFAEKTLGHRAAGGRGVFEIGVEAFEQARAPARSGLPGHEAAHPGFLEQVVAAEDFVGAFASERHLVARGAHPCGQQHHGRGGGAHDGCLSVGNGAREGGGDVGAGAVHRGVIGAQVAHELLLPGAFVEFGVVESEGKSAQRRVGVVADQGGDDGRIEAAAEIGGHGHIGAQLQPHRVDQQVAQLVGAGGGRALVFDRGWGKAPIPIAARLRAASVDRHHMAGRQRLDALEYGVWRQGCPVGEDFAQRFRIQTARHFGQGEQGLDLGGKGQTARHASVKQRPDAGAVAGQQQALTRHVPQGEGELAVELIDQRVAVVFIQVHQHFGIGLRGEAMAAALQLGAQFDVIENLAVEDHPYRAVFVAHRLVAAGQVDDAQAGVGQTDRSFVVEPLLIRPAVMQLADHRGKLRGIDGRVPVQATRNAAHGRFQPPM